MLRELALGVGEFVHVALLRGPDPGRVGLDRRHQGPHGVQDPGFLVELVELVPGDPKLRRLSELFAHLLEQVVHFGHQRAGVLGLTAKPLEAPRIQSAVRLVAGEEFPRGGLLLPERLD